MPFPSLYRARATHLNQDAKPDGSATIVVFIPAVFGEEPVQVTEAIGSLPTSPEMGWVFFQAGNPEFPVWLGRVGDGTGGGDGGGGTGIDEVWVGPDDPRLANPAIEIWYDTDAVGPTVPDSDEVWVGPSAPPGTSQELWYDSDDAKLYARVSGSWVPISTGGGGTVTAPSYTHNQGTPATTWVITHNLGFRPNVTVEDSAGTTVEGEIVHDSTIQLTLTFSASFSGVAYLS